MTLLDILNVTAPATTYLLFLSPISACLEWRNKGRSDAFSPIPFLTGGLCGALWLYYGMITGESTVIQVNLIGTVLQTVYTFVYFVYCVDKGPLLQKMAAYGAFYAAVVVYISKFVSEEGALDQLGVVCAVVNVLAIGAPLASLGDVIKSQSTETLPFPMIAFGFVVTIQWFLFGVLVNDIYMQVPNGIGIFLGIIQLSLFAIYPSKKLRTD